LGALVADRIIFNAATLITDVDKPNRFGWLKPGMDDERQGGDHGVALP
jgi:hypothetical protein